MKGLEIKKILLDNGYTLAEVAKKLGQSPQNMQNLLASDSIKTGTLEAICRAINVNIYYFYTNKDYEDIAPRIDLTSVGDMVSLEKYTDIVRENERLRMEIASLKKGIAQTDIIVSNAAV
jgi:DNA-binding Xre family transcriptional regulator